MSMSEDFVLPQLPPSFPPKKATTTKYFNGNPRNPFSRWVSLESAANCFLTFYAIFMTLMSMYHMFYIGVLCYKFSKYGPNWQVRGVAGIAGLIDKLGGFKDRFDAESVILPIICILLAIPTIYSAIRCKKYLEQGCIEGSKRHYVILFVFVALDLLGTLVADWHSVSFVCIFVIPYSLISVLGMYTTYNYVLERIQFLTSVMANVSPGAVGSAGITNTENQGEYEAF